MTIAQISATASQLEILQKINETITVSSEVKENYVSKSGATFTGTVTAPSFVGRLEGTVATAETAIKAQQDQDGVDIATNYAKLNNPTFTGTVTATTFKGNLTGTATKATQDGNGNVIANTYLPLSGGTMGGDIKTGTTDFITKTNNTGHLTFVGGTAWNKGGALVLRGMSESSGAGRFELYAHNGTNSTALIGNPNGTLTWGGNSVVTSINTSAGGVTASGSKSGNTVNLDIPSFNVNSAGQVTGRWNQRISFSVQDAGCSNCGDGN